MSIGVRCVLRGLISLGRTDEPSVRARLVAAREQERLRLHRDLHDSLGPALACIRLSLDALAAHLTNEPGARRLVTEAADQTARTTDEVRRIIDDLRPVDLDRFGLAGALRRLVTRMNGGRVTIAAEVAEPEVPLPPATEVAAYRIAAEGLTNVLRHAVARRAVLRLAVCDGSIVLEITDDGVGLPGSGVRSLGNGLVSMEQRAAEVGGCCEILPRPDLWSGTLVRAVLPTKRS